MFPDLAFIHVSDADGAAIEGSPFTGDVLGGRTVRVPGDTVRVRIVAGERAQALFGYRVERVEDQTGRAAALREEAGETYPESPTAEGDERHRHPTPVDDERVFVMADSLGMGRPCGTDEGVCERGRDRCVGGETLCVGGVLPGPERCNAEDDDCDGEVDEAAGLVDVPACPLVLGVCAGKRPSCRADGTYQPCGSLVYGPGVYELEERACDCLDNDCDGLVDGDADRGGPLPCTLDALADAAGDAAPDRACTVRAPASTPARRAYRFGAFEVAEGAVVAVAPDSGCGKRGSGGSAQGGGCLSIDADRIVIAGEVSADAGAPDCPFSCGGGSGGDVVLRADEIVVAPTGSGAGGSIRLRAPQIGIDGRVLANGVPGRDGGGPGGGAGGRGGAGRQPGAGGGGSGERDGAGGPPDPERPLELVGAVAIGPAAAVESRSGAGAGDGYVRLAGAAIAATAGVLGPAAGAGRTLLPLAMRLRTAGGAAVHGADVVLDQDGWPAPLAAGATGPDGWLLVEGLPAPLALDLPVWLSVAPPDGEGGTIALAVEDLDAAELIWTYADPEGRGACTVAIGLSVAPPDEGGDPDVVTGQGPSLAECRP